MLTKAKNLSGFHLKAIDEEIGKVKEFFFDDRHWTVRYLVADTGTWLTERQVIVSPHAIDRVAYTEELVHVNLTKQQIEESPLLHRDLPISRKFEEAFFTYYNWPVYWGGPYPWGAYPYIIRTPSYAIEAAEAIEPPPQDERWDSDLYSSRDTMGLDIQATDGNIGHMSDFVIDDENWAIRYFIVDTQNWWPGKKVLISPNWIDRVSWRESDVFINLSREAIKNSPEYSEEALNREYEASLHRHYNREGYWMNEPVSKGRADLR